MLNRVYVLNLDRRQDRLNRFLSRVAELKSHGQWLLPDPVRIRALDGAKVKPPNWWSEGAPAWGCYQGHLFALSDALNSDIKSFLIFEDDAELPNDFGTKISQLMSEIPDNWGQLYLGGHHLFVEKHPPLALHGKSLSVPFNVNGTFAMAFNGNAIQLAYSWLSDFQEFIKWPRHHVDHRLGMAHEQKVWNAYCASPFIVGHAEGKSDISKKNGLTTFFNAPRTNLAIVSSPHPPIIILGPFRSGTSLVAKILDRLGCDLGLSGRVVGGEYESFEDPAIRRLMTWAYVEPTMGLGSGSHTLDSDLRDYFAKRQVASPGRRLAVKHPSLCLSVPSLYRVLGSEWYAVCVNRSVDSVVASLNRVRWWNQKHRANITRLLFDRREVDLFRHKKNYRLNIDYDVLVSNPRQVINAMVVSLGIECTGEQIDAAVSVVKSPIKIVEKQDNQYKLFSYWVGPKPAWVEMCLESLKRYNPDIVVYTADSFLSMAEHFEHKDKFFRLAPHHQSDIVRSYLISKFGGIWCDADCIALSSFDPIRKIAESKVVVYPEKDKWPQLVCSAFFGGPKGNPNLIDYHSRNVNKLISGDPIKWGALGPFTLRNALKSCSKDMLHLMPVSQIMPIHFANRKQFMVERHDSDHANVLSDSSYAYMLTHGTGRYMVHMTRQELMDHHSFLGYLFRKALL